MSDLMDVPTFAARIGKTPDWVVREASAGRIPSRKIGRSRCFTEQDLQAFIDAAAYRATDPLAQSDLVRARRRRRTAP